MSQLFSSLLLRGLTLRNRLVVAPTCQYSAVDGLADDYQLVHLGRFALGGFGMVMVEATAVTTEGRISHGDLGLWDDCHIGPLARIASFLKENGAVPAIQLAHAGRKGSTRRPWRGEGTVTPADLEELGDEPWTTVAPSALAHASHYAQPAALDQGGIERVQDAFAQAARRALTAGFEVVELHYGHGYLLNQFLSPVANKRTDAYGGSLENRMRLPLQIARDLRQIWPADRPVLVRVSATDHIEGGWTLEDTLVLAAELRARGIDMIDCSSGGFDGAAQNAFTAYHVPYAESVARAVGIRTMAAGLIRDPHQAEAAVRDHCVDLVGLARGALIDPNWPLRAHMDLTDATGELPPWPKQVGWAV